MRFAQDKADSTKHEAGVLKPTAAAARLTVMALDKPLQLYVVLQCLLHVASLLADYADHLPQHNTHSPFCAPLRLWAPFGTRHLSGRVCLSGCSSGSRLPLCAVAEDGEC